MASDHPDTVIVDPPPGDDQTPHDAPLAPPPPREWYESPLLWAGVVVVVLLSIPALLELTGGSRKAAANKTAAPTGLLPLPPASVPVAKGPEPSIGGTAPGAPPRATPPSVAAPRPAEDARQMVIKCREPNGRIVYTQTGACTGSMVPVPIDADKNVVESAAPKPPQAAPEPASRAASR
ncbi:MAG: hypothetical protein U1E89_05375 [Burkholderiaceae bacterium]